MLGGYWKSTPYSPDIGNSIPNGVLYPVKSSGYYTELPLHDKGNSCFFFFSLACTEAFRSLMLQLRYEGWLDQATRVVTFEMVAYSANDGLFALIQLVVEFSSVGSM